MGLIIIVQTEFIKGNLKQFDYKAQKKKNNRNVDFEWLRGNFSE